MYRNDLIDKRKGLQRLLLRHMPIGYKLLVHFLLITILPSMALGVLTGWAVDRIIEKQTNENTLQLISKVNRSLEFYVSNVQNTTYLISFNPEIQKFLSDERASKSMASGQAGYEARVFLQGFTTLHSEMAGIMVVNARGEYLSNDMYARSPGNLTYEHWYQEAVKSKGIFKVIGHPQERNVTNHADYKDSEVISAVRAILDPQTQAVLGVVLIDLKLRVIAETAQDVRLGKSGWLMVVDDQGNPIYVPKLLDIPAISPQWLQDHPVGEFEKTVNGHPLQFIFRESSFTNWTTIGVFSMEEAVPEVRQIRLYIGTFVFIVCILGITASLVLSHSISRPIQRLKSFMQRAESGDLTNRYWGDSMDEIGMLGRSYNSMLTKVNDLLALTERQEKQKREAELRSLQAQIKPHFLYNTLDTIHWMAHKRGDNDVAETVEALSRLFRIGLSKGNEFIPLHEEFEHIRSYLQIQKIRYRDKLQYTLDLDPKLSHLSILKVILQPVVENAIYHGIKERRGPGLITVKADLQEGRLVIAVSDNGVGMTAETLANLRAELEKRVESEEESGGTSYGLVNVFARLRITFGPEYGIHIESEPGTGTKVTLTHPVLHEGE